MNLRPSLRPFVVVSGLPASGKTTLATKLAEALGLPLLDKDDFLEGLYDGLGVGDMAWRQRLSRASDEVLAVAARRSAGAVLTSFWRHPSNAGDAGTPADWIAALSPVIAEVHCDCPVELAVARFQSRTRHLGHNDAIRPAAGLVEKFEDAAARGPLGIGSLVRVDTSQAYDLTATVEAVRAVLRSMPASPATSVGDGYDRWAESYDDAVNATRDAAMARVRTWTSHFDDQAVLEIGCGTGLNTEHLAAHAAKVTAIDLSPGMLAVAGRRVAGAHVELRQADLRTALPGGPDTYDTVIETLVLEHIEDLAPVFAEAFRVLKPGGSVLACELHPYRQLLGKQARFATGDGQEVRIEAYRHSISDFANAATDAGFCGVRLEEDVDPSGEPRLLSLIAKKPYSGTRPRMRRP